MRKQIYHTIAVIGFIISISQPLFADGCFVTNNYGSDVYAPTQKVVISWDGKNQTMILSTKLQSDALADFGWIIPIKSKTKPRIKLGNIQVFHDLSDYFKIPTHRLILSAHAGESRFDSIQVIERKKLDIYDIVILKATDAGQLYDWLQLNNFKIGSEAKKTFSYYTNSDFYFVAIKIDLLNQYQEDIQQLEKHGLMKHISHVQVDSKHYALSDYERINRIAPISRRVYEEVRGSISNLASVISELKSGVAKPIEISFAPKEPFFPLKISSVNEGEVTILAYIISKEPLTDRSGILVPNQYKDVTSEMRRKLKKHIDVGYGRKYITKLTFRGRSSIFTRDSYFDVMTIRQKQDLSSENVAFKNDVYHAFLIQNFDLAIDLLKNKDHVETSFYEDLFLKITKQRPDRYKYTIDLSYSHWLLHDAEPNIISQAGSKMIYPDHRQTFNVRMINFLIQKIDDVNIQDKDGKTAIHHLAEIGIYNYYYAIHIMEILLNHNADINTTDKQGKTPLDYIIDHMKRSANDSKAKTGVFMLSKGGVWTQKTDGVLKNICSIEERLLEEACKSNEVDVARKLLKNYKFEKREMEHSFGYASVLGHIEIVKLLIKYGADIDKVRFSFPRFNYRCSTPLCAAIITGQVDIAEYLIRNGANLELTRFSYYEPAIILAYEAGYKKLVKLMINTGADIRRIYRKRETLLVLAAKSGDLEIVKLLINKGVLLSKESQEELAIKVALESGHKEVFEYLKKEAGYQKQ